MEAMHSARNLPLCRKVLALLGLNIFVFVGNMFALGPATAFADLAEEFGVRFSRLSDLITYPALLLGLANLLWVPTSLCIGKRPTTIISMILFLAGGIWSYAVPTYDQLFASRLVASFGAGSVESIGPSIIANMIEPRYYATAMAFYALSLSGRSQIGPLIAGYITAARDWRWFFIICIIVIAVDLVLVFFLLPETLQDMNALSTTGEFAPHSDSLEKGTEAIIENSEQVNFTPSARQELRSNGQTGRYWPNMLRLSISSCARRDGILRYWFRTFLEPISIAWRPAVLYSSLTYGFILGSVITVSTVSPQLFGAPPYLFSEIDLGLLSCASPLTDIFAHFLDRRHGNVHHQKHRLPALVVPFVICPPGIICFGYSVARHAHYMIPAVRSAMLSSGLTLVPSITMAYIAEIYGGSNGQAFVAINALKNIIGFGFSKGCYSWMNRMGVDRIFLTVAGIERGGTQTSSLH
ncbi:MFS transporter [Aspergillus cavernicola]|uniref:MFS transporter n=1 Tax=Aspergillus cavernicola TaxID=176166 RepID=A0ABR4HTJ7_9EURO